VSIIVNTKATDVPSISLSCRASRLAQEKQSNPLSYDESAAKRLWDVSAEMTKF
jgi:hypothetical protein